MYQAAQPEFPLDKKIELVAKALRAALLAAPGGQGRFLKPILTSYAVVGDLEGALGMVKEVKDRQLAADGEDGLHYQSLLLEIPSGNVVTLFSASANC